MKKMEQERREREKENERMRGGGGGGGDEGRVAEEASLCIYTQKFPFINKHHQNNT